MIGGAVISLDTTDLAALDHGLLYAQTESARRAIETQIEGMSP